MAAVPSTPTTVDNVGGGGAVGEEYDVGWDHSLEAALDALSTGAAALPRSQGAGEEGGGGGGGAMGPVATLSAAELACVEGNICMGRADWEGAVSAYTRGLSHAPHDRVLLANRSAAHFACGTPASLALAATDGQACVAAHPWWARGYHRAGLALRALGRFAAAERMLLRGRDLVASINSGGGGGGVDGATPTTTDGTAVPARVQGGWDGAHPVLAYWSHCSAILSGLKPGPRPPYPMETALSTRGTSTTPVTTGVLDLGGGSHPPLPGGLSAVGRAALLSDFGVALEELCKMRLYEGEEEGDGTRGGASPLHDMRMVGTGVAVSPIRVGDAAEVETKDGRTEGHGSSGGEAETDKFQALEAWLLSRGTSSFPHLFMKRYSENNRGVHCRSEVGPEREVMAIGREFLITVEMGRYDCPWGRALDAANVDRHLSAAKHCYLCLFVLWDRRNSASFFQPYYSILPSAYPNIPVFWDEDEMAMLNGSYLAQQVVERRENLRSDYRIMCEAVPEMRTLVTYDDFAWARMMVASRNFGIVVDGVRTDALVPYADMLNHQRPRQTRWAFDFKKQAFLIHSLVPLHQGQQVYDSYGKKCNSRFLLNYGFAVEYNRDDDTGQNHNEVRLLLSLLPPSEDAGWLQKLRFLGEHTLHDDWSVGYGHPAMRAAASHAKPRPVSRSVRVSTYADNEGTVEAFSFLRFVHASAAELATIPRFHLESDLVRRPVPPISLDNELAVLAHLARLCRDQLASYTTTLAEDVAVLATTASAALPYGSNARNALVLLKGEKEVCTYYCALHEAAVAAAAMPWTIARDTIPARYSSGCDLDRYMRGVMLQLLRRRAEEEGVASVVGGSFTAATGMRAGMVTGLGVLADGSAPTTIPARPALAAGGATSGVSGGDGGGTSSGVR